MSMKIVIRTNDLVRAHEFYSAIGIVWQDGCDNRAGEWLTAEHDPLDDHNLPRLTGLLDDVELWFYRSTKPGEAVEWSKATRFLIYYGEMGQAKHAIDRLKAANVFAPDEGFHPDFRVNVLDPDGRKYSLCDPHPFRL